MEKKELAEFRKRLEALKEKLLEGADERAEAGATVTLDQQKVGRLSRMDAMQMQAMAKAENQRVQVQLRQIDAAMDRIDNGTYGVCARCHERIAGDRLEANPATPFCTECAV